MMVFTRIKNIKQISALLNSATTLGLVCNTSGARAVNKGGMCMTANQIALNQHLETARHNVELEKVERRKARATAAQAQAAADQADVARQRQLEDARHNAEMEKQNWFQTLAVTEETRRHNVAGEEVNWFNATTNRDHYTRADQIAAENAISSRMQAEASQSQASASHRQATASLMNAQTNRSMLAESIRHNMAQETELTRANKASELNRFAERLEESRHNRQSEGIQRSQSRSAARQASAAVEQASAATLRAQNDERRLGLEERKLDLEGQKVKQGWVNVAFSGIDRVLEGERVKQGWANTAISGVDMFGDLAETMYKVSGQESADRVSEYEARRGGGRK